MGNTTGKAAEGETQTYPVVDTHSDMIKSHGKWVEQYLIKQLQRIEAKNEQKGTRAW
jgi:hypothetical protein